MKEKGFWYVIIIACVPTLVGCLLSAYITIRQAKSEATASLTTQVAILNERICNNKELFTNLLVEAEKRRSEQYLYLVSETNEIKEQLKLKRNISQIDPIVMDTGGIMISTRGVKPILMDSLHFYFKKNDSLYNQLCLNLETIAENIRKL